AGTSHRQAEKHTDHGDSNDSDPVLASIDDVPRRERQRKHHRGAPEADRAARLRISCSIRLIQKPEAFTYGEQRIATEIELLEHSNREEERCPKATEFHDPGTAQHDMP